MTRFAKGDRVRAKANLFDEGTRDRNGLLFSEKWAADGHGEWCYGTVSFVYVRRGRQIQKYRVKYDEGTSMEALEEHLEIVVGEEDSDGSDDVNEMGGSQCEDSDGSTVEGERVVQAGRAGEPREPVAEEDDGGGNVTSDSEGELGEDNMAGRGDAREPLQIGETVSVHDVMWERIESLDQDARREENIESKFTRLHFNDATKEVDVFWQL